MENAVFYCILNIPKYNKKFTEKKYTFLIFISIIHFKSFVFIVTQLADRILIIVKGFFSLPPEDFYEIICLAIGFLFTKKNALRGCFFNKRKTLYLPLFNSGEH